MFHCVVLFDLRVGGGKESLYYLYKQGKSHLPIFHRHCEIEVMKLSRLDSLVRSDCKLY